jgi:hypothetical protein
MSIIVEVYSMGAMLSFMTLIESVSSTSTTAMSMGESVQNRRLKPARLMENTSKTGSLGRMFYSHAPTPPAATPPATNAIAIGKSPRNCLLLESLPFPSLSSSTTRQGFGPVSSLVLLLLPLISLLPNEVIYE